MSFDVTLLDPKTNEPVEVSRHSEGGTYVQGGITEARLNITYNYSIYYYQTLSEEKGLQILNNMKAKDAFKLLGSAIQKLGTKRDIDYWKSTPGNAGYALMILLT